MDLQEAFDAGFESVKAYIDDALAGFERRVAAVEARPPQKGEPGEPGKSVDHESVRAMVSESVSKAVAALPLTQNGKDADPVVIARMVGEAVAAVPPPQDGKSVAIEDVIPVIRNEVGKYLSANPPKNGEPGRNADPINPEQVAKAVAEYIAAHPVKDGEPGKSIKGNDGRGIADTLIDRDGNLVVTYSDGAVKCVGPIVGRDGINGTKGADGQPGLGFDDMTEDLDADGRTVIRRYTRGDQTKEFRHTFAVVLDRGVFQTGKTYVAGDGVTWGGSFWIAQRETGDKPETSNAWRLGIKRGRDGRDGKLVATPSKTPVKV